MWHLSSAPVGWWSIFHVNCMHVILLPMSVQLARETTCVMRTYALPDGRLIRVGAERFKAPECMFTPRLIDSESEGLSEMIFSCIQVWLSNNIVQSALRCTVHF